MDLLQVLEALRRAGVVAYFAWLFVYFSAQLRVGRLDVVEVGEHESCEVQVSS